jgi:NAD(P)H-flavin reductase
MGPLGLFQFPKQYYKMIGMIAGGTGITPMLQVINISFLFMIF